jgi:hypothetical protein
VWKQEWELALVLVLVLVLREPLFALYVRQTRSFQFQPSGQQPTLPPITVLSSPDSGSEQWQHPSPSINIRLYHTGEHGLLPKGVVCIVCTWAQF